MALSALGFNVVGVDIRDYPLTAPNFTFAKANAANMSMFSDGQFDLGFCISTLEHIGLDVYGGEEDAELERAAAKEMQRVVKPEGSLLVTVPFGTPTKTDWYRVYNLARLKRLFPNIKTIKVYGKRGRYEAWEQISVAEGEQIVYSQPDSIYPTECVACIEVKPI
jgi:ubiquinone/menaquinone biosynthesis C-methylase UbiE